MLPILIHVFYAIETSTWTWIDAHVAPGLNTLPKRLSHAAVGVGSYIFITGGHDGTRYCSDLILFNLGKDKDDAYIFT